VPGPADAAPLTGADRILVGFAQALRGAGLAVPVGSVVTFAEALGRVGIDRREGVYWAGRATLVRRPEDAGVYDRVFASYWFDDLTTLSPPLPSTPVVLAVDDGPDDAAAPGPADPGSPPPLALRWSAAESLRDKDFADYTPAEWAEFQRLLSRLRLTTEHRRSRRRRPDHRHRGHPDLRRTVRQALRTGGEPIDRAWRAPTRRPRRVVLLVDISGSMESYARALLRFAHAAVAARGVARSEVFTLGTRLTRVTRQLRARDPDAALRAAATSVSDWSGGTRLGAVLEEFNDRWGTRGMARGAIVVVLSDGWDRGEPEQLAEQMARLHRVAHRIVWVNPLKASPGYAPLARGMAAALPYVDRFVEGHSLAALEHLAAVVGGGHGERRTVS
jgi:uncharacterized protein with von Willebrand factor type A (vWA) domain